MNGLRIDRNRIRCKICGDILESKHAHDYQQCSCGACFVDGGHNYCRIGWDPKYGDKQDDVVEDLVEYSVEDPDDLPRRFVSKKEEWYEV